MSDDVEVEILAQKYTAAEWIAICEEYDALSEDDRKLIPFLWFLKFR